jgi:hypothetical protein
MLFILSGILNAKYFNRLDMTARTGQPGQDWQNRKVGREQPGKDKYNRTMMIA